MTPWATGQMMRPVPTRLDAQPPRLPDHAWSAEAEGSYLALDAATHVLTYSPPSRRPSSGWSLEVGTGPGCAARVIHVRGRLPHAMTGFAVNSLDVNHFALVASDGSVMAQGVPSGAEEGFAGWYPPAAVRALAETSGLTYAEDTVSDWADLLARYPGLIPGARWLSRSATVSAVVYTTVGALFLAAALTGIVLAFTGEPGGIVLTLLGAPTGVYLVWMGPRFSSRFTRLLARRGEAPHQPARQE